MTNEPRALGDRLIEQARKTRELTEELTSMERKASRKPEVVLDLSIEYDLSDFSLLDVMEAIGGLIDRAAEHGVIRVKKLRLAGTEVPL